MNIHLKWNNVSDTTLLALFSLDIIQEENCFAKARLVVDALCSLPPTGTEGIIVLEDTFPQDRHAEPLVPAKAGISSASKKIPKQLRDDSGEAESAALQPQSNNILFKGLLIGNLTKIDGAFGEIELIAKPIDFRAKNRALQKENRHAPYWDELWVPPEKINDFEDIQDVRTASLFCHPRTGELSLSDWFEGRKTLPIHQNFFYESLQVKLRKPPLESCTVKVHAHWVQKLCGIANLGPHIRRAFPHRRVNTYTEQALTEKWPQARKRLGRSGLWILKSELKPMIPGSPLYPLYSAPLSLQEEGEPHKTYRAKRYWFKPILWVRWQRKQKRKETLSLTLFHDFQRLHPGEGKHKIIEFTLQNINPDPDAYSWQPEHFYREGIKIAYQNRIYKSTTPHTSSLTFEEDQKMWGFKKIFHTPLGSPARASFFLTPRGYQAAEHAMERAKVMLAKSARCLEVSFEGPWEDLQEITTDCSVILADPRLPGGEVRGKVIKCVLRAQGETGERTVHVTLLCSLGTGKVEKILSSPLPLYSQEGYGEEDYQVHENQVCQTPSWLSYFRYDDQGVSESLNSSSLLHGVHLINGPQDQEAEMRHHSYTTPRALKKAIDEKPTGLRLFFKDLRTKERVDHEILVKMAGRWAGPRQVSMERA